MTHRHLPWLLACAVLVTACSGGSDDDVQVFGGSTDIIDSHITLHDGRVIIKVESAPDASVDADGRFSIDGHDVAVNDAQRALLQRYNASAQAMRAHAIATGKAGMATATQALGAAAGKLTGAAADTTQQKVESAASQVRQAAAKICDDLAAMKATQDQLATQLDAFKPYAQALSDSRIAKCQEHTKG
ncbi:DUF2884 family protein [Dyella sedimenti]|uniref:DUF2884 family protein n=1 Tax=Dyella sedimenti TaxID=2919947 RepID=UPI001FAB2FDB|nr:DUF2884 family protein [Dyella sedimenti]